MSVVPFRWQGSTRTEQVRSLIAARSQEWLRGWVASPSELECAITAMTAERPDAGRRTDCWYGARGLTGVLNIRATASTFEQLGCRLGGAVSADTHGMAAGIGRRAFMDLARTLVSATGEDSIFPLDERPQPESVEPRCGVMGFLWSMEGIRAELYLDAALCDALLPKAVASTERLASRRDAILPGDVTLNAMLDLGQAALVDTVTLKPGEIIKTNMALDSIVTVRSESGETIFSGVLVAADGHRALRCIDTSRR